MDYHRRNFWIAMTVLFLLCIALLYFFVQKQNAPQAQAPAKLLYDIDMAAKESAQAQSVDIPSANPLENTSVGVNPVEKTNPFKQTYANPFQ